MKITIIGAGYVGLSLAVLLSQTQEVTVVDTDSSKVELIIQRRLAIANFCKMGYTKFSIS